jgi:REP element-mobilizing transposase RayT
MDNKPIRKPNRLPDFDYSQNGAYFITICTKDMKCVLSKIENVKIGDNNPKGKTEPVGASCARPRVILTEIGKIAEEEIKRLNNTYYGVTVERYVVMPNHIHLLIMIDIEYGRAQLAPTVSHIVQQFKGIVTKRYGQSVWQKGFHDHVIRNEEDFLMHWQYIDENPKKWLMGKDEYYA